MSEDAPQFWEPLQTEPSRPAEPSPAVEPIRCDGRTMVFLCDRTGIAARPWREAGFRCIAVDVADVGAVALEEGVTRVVCDVRKFPAVLGRPYGVMAFPPCTDLASVGSVWWDSKGEAALLHALAVADACLRFAVRSRADWWLVENPSGRMSRYWGPPDHVFSPHEFGGYLIPSGDAYTKRTCLWVGGSFVMPERRPVQPAEGSLVAVVSSVDRRDETPRGFARAVFESMQPAESFPAWLPFPAADSCRPPPRDLVCECCGRGFIRGRRDQRFCSTRCRVYAHRRGRATA